MSAPGPCDAKYYTAKSPLANTVSAASCRSRNSLLRSSCAVAVVVQPEGRQPSHMTCRMPSNSKPLNALRILQFLRV